jgi:chromosome segregation protein
MLDAGKRKQALLLEIESLGAEHERLSGLRAELDRRTSDLQSRRSEMERALQNLRREQAESTRRESALTLERDEAAMRIQAIVERLSDEFFIAPENVPEPSADTDFDPETERLLIEDLKRKIQTLGDVNMAAETDYREEKERLDFLVRERDDLVEARKTLDETIRKINHIARERFKETFERIRINFNKTFADFFEGGWCDLALEEGEDPLEANILITARPPGKNVRSINLLSSGERALTAISLLFAIYLVKPSPFCILDEVDAPLDDANIDRFLRVIREFARSTQFIIVTHNKKTMAAADNLYGITMEEPGLSTLVSVRLSQVGEKQITMEPEHTGESVVAVLG